MRPGAGPLAGEVQCWKQGSRAQLPQTESGPRTGVPGTPGALGTPGARAGMERRVSTDLLACGQSRPPFPVLSSVTGQAVEKVLLKHVPSVHGRTINEADAGSLPFDSFNERLLTSKY